ncbi:MAG: hypothetical protein ABSH06_11685 [Thermodesulfobacteriota bacterium]
MEKNELTLTSDEQNELIRLETIIENGRKSFIEVGTALMKIRNEKLYRETHRNFEEYCREKWGMTRRYANNLIASTKVIENLGTIVPIQPTAESQVRPLTNLPPDQQQEVWSQAVETAPEGKVTAKHVRATAEAAKPPKKKRATNLGPINPGDSDILNKLKLNWHWAKEGDKKKFLKWLRLRKEIKGKGELYVKN